MICGVVRPGCSVKRPVTQFKNVTFALSSCNSEMLPAAVGAVRNVEIRRSCFWPDFQARRKEGKTRFCLWSFPRFPRRVISTALRRALFAKFKPMTRPRPGLERSWRPPARWRSGPGNHARRDVAALARSRLPRPCRQRSVKQADGLLAVITTVGTELVQDALLLPTAGLLVASINALQAVPSRPSTHAVTRLHNG